MPAIFNSVPGRLKVLNIPEEAQSLIIQFDNFIAAGFMTNVTISQEVVAQVATALDQSVHVTPFGDKPTSINATVILNDTCDNDHNIVDFLKDYDRNKLHPDNSLEPGFIVMGGSAYLCYLIGHNLNLVAGGQPMYTGVMRLIGWKV